MTKLKVKPEYFDELKLFLPRGVTKDTLYEIRDVWEGYFIEGVVFAKRSFELVKEGENDVARDDVKSVNDKPKSPWFGFKYRVNPETSKLLQEAVFADGGGWGFGQIKEIKCTESPYLYVSDKGSFSHGYSSGVFIDEPLLEKRPPQPVKPVDIKDVTFNHTAIIKFDNYYKEYSYKINDTMVELLKDKKNVRLKVVGKDNEHKIVSLVRIDRGVSKLAVKEILAIEEFEIAYKDTPTLSSHKHQGSDSLVDSLSYALKDTKNHIAIKDSFIEINVNQQEESKMSKVNRRMVNVVLLDNDSGLDVADSVVYDFGKVVAEDSNDIVIQQLLVDFNVKELVEEHNKKRSKITDLSILERTGNDVKLRPVRLKDLTWSIS